MKGSSDIGVIMSMWFAKACLECSEIRSHLEGAAQLPVLTRGGDALHLAGTIVDAEEGGVQGCDRVREPA